MKDQALAAITHWIETTSLPRKFADIIAVFTIGLLGGALYFAWNAESDIRRLAIQALERAPELNTVRATKLAPTLLADVQKAGGVAVACWRVSLSENITHLVFYAGQDSDRFLFPRLKSQLERLPFVAASMSPAQLQIASAMLTGLPEVVYLASDDVTLVAVPIPDESGAYLCAFVLASIPGNQTGNLQLIGNVRFVLSEFSHSVL